MAVYPFTSSKGCHGGDHVTWKCGLHGDHVTGMISLRGESIAGWSFIFVHRHS